MKRQSLYWRMSRMQSTEELYEGNFVIKYGSSAQIMFDGFDYHSWNHFNKINYDIELITFIGYI